MSLARMLRWHFFSVQTNEFATTDKTGALDRKHGHALILRNLQGQLQATLSSSSKGRNDTIQKYNLNELETYYTLYHRYTPDYHQFGPNCRILIHKDPRKQLSESEINGEAVNVRLFEFIGIREAVGLRVRFKLFEMYLKEIHRKTI
jgi:hypothetical protein